MPDIGERRLELVRGMTPQERLLYWIEERERVRTRRAAGWSRPWTMDPILQRYRFCNVRRMDDRVSRWLLDHWYTPHRDHPNLLSAVALARFFNLPRSLEPLTMLVFGKGWPAARMKKVLRRLREEGGPIFNAAYMVRGNDGADKIDSVLDANVGALRKARVVIDLTSMRVTHERIAAVYGFGSFMAGQVVADLRHAMTGTWADRHTWAPLGPGSARGLIRLLGSDKGTMEQAIQMMRSTLPFVITTRLEAMDYQNCLCEWDKYERCLHGEGRPKQCFSGRNDLGG